MPFKSKAQQRYLFATQPDVAREFASHTKDFSKLPERVAGRKRNGRVKKKASLLGPAPTDPSTLAYKLAAGGLTPMTNFLRPSLKPTGYQQPTPSALTPPAPTLKSTPTTPLTAGNASQQASGTPLGAPARLGEQTAQRTVQTAKQLVQPPTLKPRKPPLMGKAGFLATGSRAALGPFKVAYVLPPAPANPRVTHAAADKTAEYDPVTALSDLLGRLNGSGRTPSLESSLKTGATKGTGAPLKQADAPFARLHEPQCEAGQGGAVNASPSVKPVFAPHLRREGSEKAGIRASHNLLGLAKLGNSPLITPPAQSPMHPDSPAAPKPSVSTPLTSSGSKPGPGQDDNVLTPPQSATPAAPQPAPAPAPPARQPWDGYKRPELKTWQDYDSWGKTFADPLRPTPDQGPESVKAWESWSQQQRRQALGGLAKSPTELWNMMPQDLPDDARLSHLDDYTAHQVAQAPDREALARMYGYGPGQGPTGADPLAGMPANFADRARGNAWSDYHRREYQQALADPSGLSLRHLTNGPQTRAPAVPYDHAQGFTAREDFYNSRAGEVGDDPARAGQYQAKAKAAPAASWRDATADEFAKKNIAEQVLPHVSGLDDAGLADWMRKADPQVRLALANSTQDPRIQRAAYTGFVGDRRAADLDPADIETVGRYLSESDDPQHKEVGRSVLRDGQWGRNAQADAEAWKNYTDRQSPVWKKYEEDLAAWQAKQNEFDNAGVLTGAARFLGRNNPLTYGRELLNGTFSAPSPEEAHARAKPQPPQAPTQFHMPGVDKPISLQGQAVARNAVTPEHVDQLGKWLQQQEVEGNMRQIPGEPGKPVSYQLPQELGGHTIPWDGGGLGPKDHRELASRILQKRVQASGWQDENQAVQSTASPFEFFLPGAGLQTLVGQGGKALASARLGRGAAAEAAAAGRSTIGGLGDDATRMWATDGSSLAGEAIPAAGKVVAPTQAPANLLGRIGQRMEAANTTNLAQAAGSRAMAAAPESLQSGLQAVAPYVSAGSKLLTRPFDTVANLVTGKGSLQNLLQGRIGRATAYGAPSMVLPYAGASLRGEEMPSVSIGSTGGSFAGVRPLVATYNWATGQVPAGEARMAGPVSYAAHNLRDLGTVVETAAGVPFSPTQRLRGQQAFTTGVAMVPHAADEIGFQFGFGSDAGKIKALEHEEAKGLSDGTLSPERQQAITKERQDILKSRQGPMSQLRQMHQEEARAKLSPLLDDPNTSPTERARIEKTLSKGQPKPFSVEKIPPLPPATPGPDQIRQMAGDFNARVVVGDLEGAEKLKQEMLAASGGNPANVPLDAAVAPLDASHFPGLDEAGFAKMVDGDADQSGAAMGGIAAVLPGPYAKWTQGKAELAQLQQQAQANPALKPQVEAKTRELADLHRAVQGRAAAHYERRVVQPMLSEGVPAFEQAYKSLQERVKSGEPVDLEEIQSLRQYGQTITTTFTQNALRKALTGGDRTSDGKPIGSMAELAREANKMQPVVGRDGRPVVGPDGQPVMEPASPIAKAVQGSIERQIMAMIPGNKTVDDQGRPVTEQLVDPAISKGIFERMDPQSRMLTYAGLGLGAIGLLGGLFGFGGAWLPLLGLLGAGTGLHQLTGGSFGKLMDGGFWKDLAGGSQSGGRRETTLNAMSGANPTLANKSLGQVESPMGQVSLAGLQASPQFAQMMAGKLPPDQTLQMIAAVRPHEREALKQMAVSTPGGTNIAGMVEQVAAFDAKRHGEAQARLKAQQATTPGADGQAAVSKATNLNEFYGAMGIKGGTPDEINNGVMNWLKSQPDQEVARTVALMPPPVRAEAAAGLTAKVKDAGGWAKVKDGVGTSAFMLRFATKEQLAQLEQAKAALRLGRALGIPEAN